MDIDTEMKNFVQSFPTSEAKTNIFVIGERKCGKTTLIKKFFEKFNEVPETNFLLDSVKSWEGCFAIEGGRDKISFIEMDVDAAVLDRVSKFDQVMKGFSKIIIVTNKFFKKKSTNEAYYNYTDSVSALYINEMKTLFQSNIYLFPLDIIFFDFAEIFPEILNFVKTQILNTKKLSIKDEFEMKVVKKENLEIKQEIKDIVKEEESNVNVSSSKKFQNLQIIKNEEDPKVFHNFQNFQTFQTFQTFPTFQTSHSQNTNIASDPKFTSQKKKKKIFKIYKTDRKYKKYNEPLFKEQNCSKVEKNDSEVESEEEDSNVNQHLSSNMNPNSLISISKEVFSFLKKTTHSKGSSVTEYILENLQKSQTTLSFKNIQRRVYDAINVMNAVGIIQKQKNNLQFNGKINLLSKTQSIKSERPKLSSKQMKEKIKSLSNSINLKQYELIGLCSKVFKVLITQLYLSNKLVSLNKNDLKRKSSCDKLGYPFTLIKQKSDASFVIKQDDLNTRLCILSDKPLDIINEDRIVKAFLKDE